MKKILIGIGLFLHSCVFAQNHSLDYYLTQAKDNSPLLKDYQNQQASVRVDSQLLLSTLRPQVNGISNNLYAPVISGYGYDNAITNGAQLSAQVQVSKTFVSRNNLTNQLQAFSLDGRSIGNTAVIAGKDLKKTVTAQYISAYGNMVTMNFNAEILALLQKEDTLLKALTRNNIYKQADYLTFYVTLQQQRLLLRQSEIQFKNDYATLNYLCGIVDTATQSLADPSLRLATLPDAYTSSFYRQFTIDSLKFLNQRSAINYTYKPKISAFADAGYLSSLSYQIEKNFGASVGLTLNIPIYDGRQRQLKYKKLDIAERTRTGYRDFFLRQYAQQIAQLTQQLRSIESLLEEINSQIKYSNTLISVNEKLLETGNIRITDFIIAINTYLNAKNLLTQNYISRMQIINQINYWEAL